jgi:two-component system, LuxR family, response regulator FixJ
MRTPCKPGVYVVDDDTAVRDSLRELVESAGLHAALYASAEEFLASADAGIAGCLLLDIRMAGLSGLDLQQVLRTREIDLPVIVISGHGDVPAATRAFKQGAIDFIQKPFDPPALLQSIRAALEHDARIRAARAHQSAIAARLATLSLRERQVLTLLTAGLVNKQIAATLGIAERTVEFHRTHIMDKTGAGSLLHLVRMVAALRPGDHGDPSLSDPMETRS